MVGQFAKAKFNSQTRFSAFGINVLIPLSRGSCILVSTVSKHHFRRSLLFTSKAFK